MIFAVFILVCTAILARNIFIKNNLEVENFEGKKVPYSLGIFIFVSYFFFHLLFIERWTYEPGWFYLFSLWLTGFIDDLYGTKNEKGLRGHFKALFLHGTMSTGILKIVITAIFVGYVLIFSWPLTFAEWLCFGLILMLAPHVMNLFDTRPLRVWKASLLYFIVLLPFLPSFSIQAYIYIAIVFIIFFLFEGYKLAMLGDNGATLIGGIIALWTVKYVPIALQWLFVGNFLILTVMAERISFSEWIEKYRLLKWIDRLGVQSTK